MLMGGDDVSAGVGSDRGGRGGCSVGVMPFRQLKSAAGGIPQLIALGFQRGQALGRWPWQTLRTCFAEITLQGAKCMRELAALADEKGSLFWKTVALSIEARHLALTGDAAKALPRITFARNAFRSTGANFLAPLDLSVLAIIMLRSENSTTLGAVLTKR